MMLFRNNNHEHIRNFHISTSSSGQNNPIAYGPGSIINGKFEMTHLVKEKELVTLVLC